MALQGESRIRKATVKVVQTARQVRQAARSLRFALPLSAALIVTSCGTCQRGVEPVEFRIKEGEKTPKETRDEILQQKIDEIAKKASGNMLTLPDKIGEPTKPQKGTLWEMERETGFEAYGMALCGAGKRDDNKKIEHYKKKLLEHAADYGQEGTDRAKEFIKWFDKVMQTK